MIDQEIFTGLQAKIEEDSKTRETIREHVQELEREGERLKAGHVYCQAERARSQGRDLEIV